MSQLWRFVPLLHAIFFVIFAVAMRLFFAAKRGGRILSFARSQSPEGYVARCFYLWLPLVDAAYLVLHVLANDAYGSFEFNSGVISVLRKVGAVALVISLCWVLSAQSAMGDSWRMGIDDTPQRELISSGLFRFSRNPVYLGIRFSLVAQVLVIQTWPVALIAVCCDLLAQIQVRFEEDYLKRCFSKEFADYSSRVRRWL
ncbi:MULTISPECIES: isoprenylcysteine carboxylmethyltransferase family protein [unclassified Caballeronia]|uniref:methyltransferase family protein n=1 Tax=unclassified Caballeronia TaxID=2646786 RepID=UPI000A06A191|nr:MULTISPECIES: isoprenylcysteine carboxylmethyltransferase family protein [unclassified Caballeronia]MCE4546474.1 isoprenylcysteine carboxylmethyltransferase family protein [Caballeronia sp. PC1]MCE4573052.1 isoprenylcysteine carboxylmethyltransferase family protein [Caballeronia sp. CLC5]